MGEFSDFISELGLMAIPLLGGGYTWSSNHAWSRIDRFLISPSWEIQYPDFCQKRLTRLCSDHFPILLDCGGIPEGKRPFKFENMWLKSEGFVELVRRWWNSYQMQGTPSKVLAGKLKALKRELKTWNEQVFGNVEAKKKSLFQELQSLEGVEDEEG
ncbi:hypothetical protein CIPAW_11G196100 [Carya illinoinensis]|uniref:Uncharacterized protein n=1 Tax=Carya illinoinensis TaxID=32201 RepID=A0A8T1P7G7_CARIL|nr:hypothetical protein CIPAW_11G196100 [Carya illinoinensis]